MKVGCHLPMFGDVGTRERLVTFSRRMEELGFSSLWASDHVVIPYEIRSKYPYSESGRFPLPPTASFLEPLTALTVAATVTERIALGTSVLVLPHRHPVLAAKTLATLDHIAGGRVILGVGVGWMREEIALLGAPFEKRGAWSDEAIGVMRTCWRDERSAFRGEFFDFDALGVYPKPPRGDIPIWVGGHSASAFRRAGRLSDGWHAAFATVEQIEPARRRLDEELRAAGRPPDSLTLSVRMGLSARQSSTDTLSQLWRYRDVGVNHVVLETSYRSLPDMLKTYDRFASDVLPKL
jgi:probable F420-dependent oxidoreductase